MKIIKNHDIFFYRFFKQIYTFFLLVLLKKYGIFNKIFSKISIFRHFLIKNFIFEIIFIDKIPNKQSPFLLMPENNKIIMINFFKNHDNGPKIMIIMKNHGK